MLRHRLVRWLGVFVLSLAVSITLWMTTRAQAAPGAAIAQSSPTANPLRNAYFGDTHVHTGWSFDAYAQGVRTSPEDAYRYAEGEAIPHTGGFDIQLKKPLDFYMVTDHAEYLGIMPELAKPDTPLAETPIGAQLSQQVASGDPQQFSDAYLTIQGSITVSGEPITEISDPTISRSIFQQITEIADRHYRPGTFTTFPAYEWTSNPDGRNLHRNIIFRSSDQLPDLPFTAFDSDRPEDLWDHLDGLRAEGITVLAIPHNGNLSDGAMFPLLDSDGNPIDRDYAEQRRRNEPLFEIAQIKGQSETNPVLSDTDQFAGYGVSDFLLAGEATGTARGQARGSYTRDAYKTGLWFEETIGVNPYKFGLVGGSDTHNSGGPYEEDNYFGKIGTEDGTPERRLNNPAAKDMVLSWTSAALSGVWAEENTREAIYDALARKETFGTSGPRMQVRLFGSWDFTPEDASRRDFVQIGYDQGVPMGADLAARPDSAQAPTFLVAAMKDPDWANLDRIQIVKGWVESGQRLEKVYDVALADGRRVDTETGTAPAVGNTVNLADATFSNEIGDAQLMAYWTDPDFDPRDRAFYYARVLEIPTPRWSTYDAIRSGVPLPEGVPPTIQERAWSSPIWYTPSAAELAQAQADALTVGDLEQQGGRALTTPEIEQLVVGQRLIITNRISGETFDAFYQPDGQRSLSALAGFSGFHGGAGQNIVNPYEIRDNQLFASLPDGSQFSSRIYQVGDQLLAARSDEAGYVNYALMRRE